MASPPNGGATSPPAASPLALPRQRPSLALPPNNPQSRKPSSASATSSTHPLRQTSFPPSDSLDAQHALAEVRDLAQEFSPTAEDSEDQDDLTDDNDIRSAISGPAAEDALGSGRKRKRPGEKKPRGRPSIRGGGRGQGSLVSGDDARSQPTGNRRGGTAGAPSVLTADDADGEAEEDDLDDDAEDPTAGPGGGGRVPLYEGGQMTPTEAATEHARRNAFYESASEEHKARYDSWQRAKLRTADVRRLVNQTLSQSVPQNVVLVVSAYAKMFAGMLTEEAREVQGEWEAVEEKRADGGENRALKRLKRTYAQANGDGDEHPGEIAHESELQTNGETNGTVKAEPTSPDNQLALNGIKEAAKAAKPDDDDDSPSLHPGGAAGLSTDVEECDRGPLLPDHLREALRRYKKRRAGGPVGFTGLSLEGRENTAPRMGGRRLFR